MQIVYDGYTMDVKNCDFEDDYTTKYVKKYHIKTFPFSLVGKDGQGYAIEACFDGDSSGKANLTVYVIFTGLLVNIIEAGGEKEVRDKMRKCAILNTEIMLEKGQTGDTSIKVDSKKIGEGSLLYEIKKLEKELKNAQEKRIGF